jgi:hypothetical protein
MRRVIRSMPSSKAPAVRCGASCGNITSAYETASKWLKNNPGKNAFDWDAQLLAQSRGATGFRLHSPLLAFLHHLVNWETDADVQKFVQFMCNDAKTSGAEDFPTKLLHDAFADGDNLPCRAWTANDLPSVRRYLTGPQRLQR